MLSNSASVIAVGCNNITVMAYWMCRHGCYVRVLLALLSEKSSTCTELRVAIFWRGSIVQKTEWNRSEKWRSFSSGAQDFSQVLKSCTAPPTELRLVDNSSKEDKLSQGKRRHVSSSISYHSIHPFSTVMKQTLTTIFKFIATPALWPHMLLKEVSVFTLWMPMHIYFRRVRF